MKLHTFHLPLTAISLATAALISACGGSSSSSTSPTTLSGQVIDGYIKGATVCLDLNGNNACDSGEPSTTSGDKGAYSLSVPAGTNISGLHVIASVPATGATDTDDSGTATPVITGYTMLSPASMAIVVSPLTTVISHEMKNNGRSVAEARVAARTELGLKPDYDFMKDHVKEKDADGMNAAKQMAGFLANFSNNKAPSNTALKEALDGYKAGKAGAGNGGGGNTGGGNSGGGNSGGGNTGGGNAGVITPGTNMFSLDAANVTYTLTDFGGATATKDAGPAGSTGQVAKVVKGAVGTPSETWAGTTMSTGAKTSLPTIPLTATAKTISVRVYSPTSGTPIRLKLEDAADGTHSVEAQVNTTAIGWQTLTFDFSTPATGTAAWNAAYTYSKASIFMNFGVAGTGETYYFDDLIFVGGAGAGNAGGGNTDGGNTGGGNTDDGNTDSGIPFVGTSKVTFEADDSTGAVLRSGWGGATSSVEESPPEGGNGKAGKIVVADQAQYHGATFLVLTNAEICSATNPNLSIRVHTPAAGTSVELKLEQDGDDTKNTELRKNTTVAGWETINFNCLKTSDHAAVTAPYVEATVYNKVSILFDMPNKSAGTKTYYFDDVSYTPTAAATYVAPPPSSDPATAPAAPTKAAADVKSLYSDAYTDLAGTDWNPGWGQSTVVSEVTIGSNKIRKYATMNYQGVALAADTDVSAFTHLHIDIYNTGSATPVKIYVISTTGATHDTQFFTATPSATGWNSFDIPMTTYSSVDKTKVSQLKFDVQPNNGGTVYYDNLYFWK